MNNAWLIVTQPHESLSSAAIYLQRLTLDLTEKYYWVKELLIVEPLKWKINSIRNHNSVKKHNIYILQISFN